MARQLIGTVLKDNPDDGKKLRHYFDVVVKQRAKKRDGRASSGAGCSTPGVSSTGDLRPGRSASSPVAW